MTAKCMLCNRKATKGSYKYPVCDIHFKKKFNSNIDKYFDYVNKRIFDHHEYDITKMDTIAGLVIMAGLFTFYLGSLFGAVYFLSIYNTLSSTLVADLCLTAFFWLTWALFLRGD